MIEFAGPVTSVEMFEQILQAEEMCPKCGHDCPDIKLALPVVN